MLDSLPVFAIAVLSSGVAGLATGLGALPVFALRTVGERTESALLGFGAGVMLAATGFSLLLPALEHVGRALAPPGVALVVGGSVLLGGLTFTVANRWVPHEHFVKGREGPEAERLGQVWLFVLAITLHNFPEGLAVGVGYGPDDLSNGLAVTAGISLQNMPEGLVVAVALRGAGVARGPAFGWALLTGLVEPVGAVVGAATVALADFLLAPAMAFAAGAMLFVISDEIIPESHRGSGAALATQGFLLGFVLMMVLDIMLG